MEFRRIENLPPYVFTIINNLKIEARRGGADVIDLGFGNPDIPSPDIAVEKLAEAAQNPRNHRYSLSRGLPKLREAIAGYYKRDVGRRSRSRARDHQHDRLEGGLQPPDVGAARPWRRGDRAEPRAIRSTCTARCSPVPICARCRSAASATPRRATTSPRTSSTACTPRTTSAGPSRGCW